MHGKWFPKLVNECYEDVLKDIGAISDVLHLKRLMPRVETIDNCIARQDDRKKIRIKFWVSIVWCLLGLCMMCVGYALLSYAAFVIFGIDLGVP